VVSAPVLGVVAVLCDGRKNLLAIELLESRSRRGRLAASGQIKLRRIDGWRKIAAVLSQHTAVAA
jgi:hypothetical protein